MGGIVIFEGIRRLFEPPEVGGSTMLWFGIIGLAGNVIGLIVLASGRRHNINMRAAYLEVLNDALGSVAVIVAAVIIAVTCRVQADAVVSLLIGALIIPRTLKLLSETLNVLMENAPAGLDLAEVQEHILAAQILADLQRCVAEHFEVSVEHSTFQIEPAAHRVQESIPH